MDDVLAGDLHHPAVTAVLSTAADLLSMELVFIGGLDEAEFAFLRVVGTIPGVEEGATLPRADSFCHRMLAGAPPATADAASEPAYADVPAREAFGITSYVGVPVHARDGQALGTLCGVDRGSVSVDATVLHTLQSLARIIEAHLSDRSATLVRRTAAGWSVAGTTEDDLTSAMVLADLLAEDLPPEARPPRVDSAADELDRLRVAVTQLEHALAARVIVEQAIGVLAERQRLAPRAAFERMRKAARSRGRRVHDLARMVVASVTDSTVPLPPELAGRR